MPRKKLYRYTAQLKSGRVIRFDIKKVPSTGSLAIKGELDEEPLTTRFDGMIFKGARLSISKWGVHLFGYSDSKAEDRYRDSKSPFWTEIREVVLSHLGKTTKPKRKRS